MIHIWIRSTLDWEDEAAFKSQLRPNLVESVELWNQSFNIPFHLFRHRIREISRLNLAKVDGAVCTAWNEIPEGSLVVPVDDDDWFAPNLATILINEQETDLQAYFWPSNFLEVPVHLRHQLGRFRRALFPSTPAHHLCTTNNYAMIKGSETKPLLASHLRASQWYKSNINRVKELGEPLSIMNRTLGSTTSMKEKRPPFASQKLLLGFLRYRQLYNRRASPQLDWSQPYRDMMAALMREL